MSTKATGDGKVYASPGVNRIFIHGVKGERIEIDRGSDDQWRDIDGTIYAIPDLAHTTDTITRCGVGIFSLPEHWAITRACAPHDFKYDSVTYQLYHDRSEADGDLARDVHLITKSEVDSDAFWLIVRALGSEWWENPATND